MRLSPLVSKSSSHRQLGFNMVKRKAAESEPVSSDADRRNGTPTTVSSKHKSKKQKIDWATIDDIGFDGFTVKSVALRASKSSGKPQSKKPLKAPSALAPNSAYKNASLNAQITQKNPFEETDLSEVHCKIEPAAEWESTQRYRKFTINGAEFEFGQIVFVKKSDEPHDTPEAIPQWFAKVLEVRAGDASHVYLRVFWAYRPEDLPGGRQPYHGESELIVSNHMDVIEALTVESVANVIYWDDNPEKSEWPAKHQLFWRQSFDINKPRGKQLAKLSTHCIDKSPCNPDEPLVYCPSCKKWLHARCLEDQAIKEASIKSGTSPSDSTEAKASLKKAKKTTDDSSTVPAFGATLSTLATGKTCLIITDNRLGENKRQWNVDVKCLMCSETIENLDDSPQDSSANTPTINNSAVNSHEANHTRNGVISTTNKSDLPLHSEDKDSVISNDASTNGTVKPGQDAQVPRTVRGRGRPRLEDAKRKRGRSRKSITTTNGVVQTTNTTTAILNTRINVVETTTVVKTTPAPVQAAESVFQVGLNSVKKLLRWTT